MRASNQLRNAFAALQTSLPSRKWPPLIEPLTTTSAHRLSQSLEAYLPPSWLPALPALPSASTALPPGYHLVYFNPVLAPADLLPDGTDQKHSPGAPFVRRMWAGGSVRVRDPRRGGVRLDGGAGVCLERIRDVAVKGGAGQEKVFVGIERRMGRAETRDGRLLESEEEVARRLWSEHGDEFAGAELVEWRNIVFMRERTPEELQAALRLVDAPRNVNVKKATQTPTVSHTLVPTSSLLFRYSALTMNAHAIHLDPHYCRTVEGHRNLLFHGPMTCTLLMTMLEAQVKPVGKAIAHFSYRNVAPLYAGEELKLCAIEGADGKSWRLWVENSLGEIAVKAEAETVDV